MRDLLLIKKVVSDLQKKNQRRLVIDEFDFKKPGRKVSSQLPDTIENKVEVTASVPIMIPFVFQ